jgi:hypothetical protein
VHDSAVAIVMPRERSSAATCSSTVEPSVENSVSACRARTTSSNAAYAGAAAGSKRVTTSSSPRRRQVVISSSSRPATDTSAARSVSAISDSGIPYSRSVRCS